MTAVRGDYHVRGMRLAYHTWGDPSSPAVLAFHGFMDHGRSYAPTMRHVTHDLFVVAPDFRGHGASEWVGPGGYYHFYDYFDDVRRLLDHLAIDRFSVVGHSMGGSVATATAALHAKRVDRVLLLEGMGPPFSDLADTVDRLNQWLDVLGVRRASGDAVARRRCRVAMKDLGEAVDKLCRVNPRLPRERARELASTFTEPADEGEGIVWCQDPLHRTPAAKPFLEAEARMFWSALTMPVLSLYGEHGWPPERLEDRHAAVPHLTSRVVRDAGHNIHHDRPELVAQILDDFVAEGRVEDWPGVFG
jgi:pimeloyl-ACP methyl ester carboxylesterase